MTERQGHDQQGRDKQGHDILNPDAQARQADGAACMVPDSSDPAVDAETPRTGVGRRKLLLGGGMAAAGAIVSIRPALAGTAASVLNCQIPVPDPAKGAGQMIAPDGKLVPKGTKGAFPGTVRPFTGEEVRKALSGKGRLPGTTYEQNRAYLKYIGRLQQGTSGFTCYASLQMPR